MFRKRKLDISSLSDEDNEQWDQKDPFIEKMEENRPKLPMLFAKASTSTDDDNSNNNLYSKLQKDNATNLVRHKTNTFKGKKYGIGAKLMAKMGYVEGEGLGANHQGILEPVESQVRKMGVGIGDDTLKKFNDDEDEVSSDEEYYKEVPKKSLFQIIREIESKNVVVPQWIKKVSDENSELADKPFIALKKESEENGVDIDVLRVKLNEINDEFDELVDSAKMADFEIAEQKRDLEKTEVKISKYNQLLECLKQATISDEEGVMEILYKLKEFLSLDIDIPKLMIKILKPIITEKFSSWTPFDLDENEMFIPSLIKWKSLVSDQNNLDYDELPYFDSLISSLWLSKMSSSFEHWSISQPNLAISLLLDWSEIIPEQVFNYFISNTITPKLIDGITNWDYKDDNEEDTPPYIWIFEWLGVLKTGIDDVEREFIIKYKGILNSWSLESDGVIPGINSFKEIYGSVKYNELINDSILKNVIKFFNIHQFELNDRQVDYEFNLLKKLENFHIDNEVLKNVWIVCYWNTWLKSIFLRLTSSKFVDYEKFADYVDKFYRYIKNELDSESSSVFRKGLLLINQFLENPSDLISAHHSYTIETATSKILKPVIQEQKHTNVNSIPGHKLTITFKNVLEKYCDENNLFLTPLNKELLDGANTKNLSDRSGNLYYKISYDLSGKKGKIGYIEHDVLFIKKRIDQDNEQFWPVSIDELINELQM